MNQEEVRNAVCKAPEKAGRSGFVGRQDQLELDESCADGSAQLSNFLATDPEWRLKLSLEVFPASDGRLYLLRSGSQADFVIEKPSAADRLILRELERGFHCQSELEQLLVSRGHPAGELAESLLGLERTGLLDRRRPDRELDAGDEERYLRQLIYFSDLEGQLGAGADTQRRLQGATVLILGTGGLGCWAAAALVCAGLGQLVLVDDDTVELGNLNRQMLFSEADIGRLKVEAAADALRAHNQAVAVFTEAKRVTGQESFAELLEARSPDLVLATADWPPYELARWVNGGCLAHGIPYLSAGQFPPLLRVGPLVLPGDTACLECQEQKARTEFPLYDELAEFRRDRPTSASTFGAASGLIGTLLASEALHYLTGLGRPATAGAAAVIDMQTLEVSLEVIARDPSCSQCGSLESGRAGYRAGSSRSS